MDPELQVECKLRRRIRLRAWNGAALGSVLGGAVGYVAVFVTAWMLAVPFPPYLAALVGTLPGMISGATLGPAMALSDEMEAKSFAWIVGIVWGTLLVLTFRLCTTLPSPVPSLIVLLGTILHAIVVGSLLRRVRGRFGWWKRWDSDCLQSDLDSEGFGWPD